MSGLAAAGLAVVVFLALVLGWGWRRSRASERRVYCFTLEGEPIRMENLELGQDFEYVRIFSFVDSLLDKPFPSWPCRLGGALFLVLPRTRARLTSVVGRNGTGSMEVMAEEGW